MSAASCTGSEVFAGLLGLRDRTEVDASIPAVSAWPSIYGTGGAAFGSIRNSIFILARLEEGHETGRVGWTAVASNTPSTTIGRFGPNIVTPITAITTSAIARCFQWVFLSATTIPTIGCRLALATNSMRRRPPAPPVVAKYLDPQGNGKSLEHTSGGSGRRFFVPLSPEGPLDTQIVNLAEGPLMRGFVALLVTQFEITLQRWRQVLV